MYLTWNEALTLGVHHSRDFLVEAWKEYWKFYPGFAIHGKEKVATRHS